MSSSSTTTGHSTHHPTETPAMQRDGPGVIATIVHALGKRLLETRAIPLPHLWNCCRLGRMNRCIQAQFTGALSWLLSIIAGDTSRISVAINSPESSQLSPCVDAG